MEMETWLACHAIKRRAPPHLTFSLLSSPTFPTCPQRWLSSLRATYQMSVAGSEAEDYTVFATDLLAYDEERLVDYLKRQDSGGRFDISSLAGVTSLSGSQKEHLAQKLR